MRIACIQPVFDAIDDRVGFVVEKARRAEDVDLLVLPELWHVGYFAFEKYDEGAESIDGPTITAMSSLARDLTAFVHAGSIVERASDGKLYNTSVLISPDGRVAHTYRKIHLFGYRSKETELLTPGHDVGSIVTEVGNIGMTTCYDLRFPELYRALEEAQIFLVASAWPIDRIEHWRLLTRARALENLCYLVACNAAGTDSGVTLGGHSVVVDPWGGVIAEAGVGDEVLVADIDIERAAKLRSEFPWTADRRLHIAVEQ